MIQFYIPAFIILFVGLCIWLKNQNITRNEWLISACVALLFSSVTHLAVVEGMSHDAEIRSGALDTAVFYPRWVEKYRVSHTRRVGKTTTTYYTTHYRTHSERWEISGIIYPNGSRSSSCSSDFYNEVVRNFGGEISKEWTHKGGFYSGDHNIYVTKNKTGYLYPITKWESYENKVKASDHSLFHFSNVPTNITTYQYPLISNWLQSDRLLGDARNRINQRDFDIFNSKMAAIFNINIIAIGFTNDSEIAEWQRTKWIGGKRNDIVLCYGVANGKTTWSRVFGWTESELCKRNIETILLSYGLGQYSLSLVEKEIRASYRPADFHKFDYLTVQPPKWVFPVYLILVLAMQGGLWYYFNTNEFNRKGNKHEWD